MTLGDRVVVMKDGRIQQCGSPFEVYERPVNRFVAGFMGMPPMNFLDGIIVRRDDRLAFEDGDCRLSISSAHSDVLGGLVDQPVVLGIRPEALSLTSDPPPDSCLRFTVRVVEPLGDRMDVHGETGQSRSIVCRTDARADIREDETINLRVDMNRVHFFEDGEFGRNLSLPVTDS